VCLAGLNDGDGESAWRISWRVFIRFDSETIALAGRDEPGGGERLRGCDVVDVADLIVRAKLRSGLTGLLLGHCRGDANKKKS